nr:MAG TPA: hypothetical protein [Caudoviricetes sp.]
MKVALTHSCNRFLRFPFRPEKIKILPRCAI